MRSAHVRNVYRWSQSEPNRVCNTYCQRCFWSLEAALRMSASSPPSRAWTLSDAADLRSPGCRSQRWNMNPKTGNGWNLPASPSAMKCTYLVRRVHFLFLFIKSTDCVVPSTEVLFFLASTWFEHVVVLKEQINVSSFAAFVAFAGWVWVFPSTGTDTSVLVVLWASRMLQGF